MPGKKKKGMTHGFVVEFENEQDRGYYVDEDPAHREFAKGVEGLVTNVTVVDYVPGVY